MRLVAGPRVGGAAGGGDRFFWRAGAGRAGLRCAHRAQRAAGALVCRRRGGCRAVEPGAAGLDGPGQRRVAGAHRRPAGTRLAMGGGLCRHFFDAVAGHGIDGRHAAGDGPPAGAAALASPPGRRAVRLQYAGRGDRRAGCRLLAGANVGPGAHRRPVRRAQRAVRRGGAGAAAGGLPGGHGAGGGGVCPWLGRPARARSAAGRPAARRATRPARRPPAVRAGAGLPAGRGQPVGGRQHPGRGAARPRPWHGPCAGGRSHAGAGGIFVAHGADGRAVQPPHPARAVGRRGAGPRAGRQYAGRGGRAAAAGRAGAAGAGRQGGAAGVAAGLPGAAVAACLGPTRRLGGSGPGAALALGAPPLVFVDVPDGGRLVS